MLVENIEICGRYLLRDIIGRGGTGYVYQAFDTCDNRIIALKLFKKGHCSQTSYERFAREVLVLQSVTHEAIQRILDVGTRVDGTPFYTMPILKGNSLFGHFTKNTFSYRESVEIAVQILEGLSAAHKKKIIHRNLKPTNIFLVQNSPRQPRSVRILDFGISKILDPTLPPLTESGIGIGTEKYMSPEQRVNSKAADERADVYAMGLIFYELFYSRNVFAKSHLGKNDTNLLNSFQTPTLSFKSPVSKNANIPSGLADLIITALSPDPNSRFRNATAMLNQFRKIVHNPDIIDLNQLTYRPPVPHTTKLQRKPNRISLLLKRSI